MFNLRSLAIVLTGAGVFAGLPLTNAQACDDDRFPCPVVSEAQETTAEPAPAAQPRKKAEHPSRQAAPQKRADTVAKKPAPSAQPPKKAAKHPAPPTEKTWAKVEPAAPRDATGAKASQPAVQEQVAAPIGQEPSMFPNAAAAVLPPSPADQGANSPNASLVAAAGPVWPALPNADAGSATEGTVADAAQASRANAVQVVNPNDVNELDQAAIALTPAETSWITYVLLVLGAAFAAAPATWFLARMTSGFVPSGGSTHAHEQLVNEKVTSYSPSRCRRAANADARLSEVAMIMSRRTRSVAKSGIRSSTIG